MLSYAGNDMIQLMKRGFTLPELLISISILAVVAMLASSIFIQSIRADKKQTVQDRIYEDVLFILDQIGKEVAQNAIDYDEYYNEYVARGASYGQSFGAYYSSFFHPGDDDALGFDCNDAPGAATPLPTPAPAERAAKRNGKSCTPVRKTLDIQTGVNPYTGKANVDTDGHEENAFCGEARVTPGQALQSRGLCKPNGEPDFDALKQGVPKLFLISPDASQKTILARERIGGTAAAPIYALSLLRMKGVDTNGDSQFESFVCADAFECHGLQPVAGAPQRENLQGCPDQAGSPGQLPRPNNEELNPPDGVETCDTREQDFAKDFIPYSPLTMNVTRLNFIIEPLEDPAYAFAETDQSPQPRVTVIITAEPNKERIGVGADFAPVTFTKTVYAAAGVGVRAPVRVR